MRAQWPLRLSASLCCCVRLFALEADGVCGRGRRRGRGRGKKRLEGLILWYVPLEGVLERVRVNEEASPHTKLQLVHRTQLIYWLARATKQSQSANATWVSEAHMTAGHDQEVGITGGWLTHVPTRSSWHGARTELARSCGKARRAKSTRTDDDDQGTCMPVQEAVRMLCGAETPPSAL